MKHEDIKKILDDLYALDPSLRAHEKELTSLIHAMAIKPEAQYDPAFAATLRTQLLSKLSASAAARPQRRTLASIFMGQQLRYASLALVIVALAGVTLVTLHPKTGANGTLAFNSSKQSITTVAPNAFGTLSALNTTGNTANTANSGGTATPSAVTASGNNTATTKTNAMMTPAAVIARPISPIFPGGGFNTTKYVYAGDAFSQNQAQLNVLKQTNQSFSADQATAALESAGFGQVNLSSFGGLTMNNVTLSQNQSFGYNISIDLQNGTISIDQNYTEWPQSVTTQLTASNIPSNSAVIATANQFLSTHGISIANYGTPQVSPTNYAIPMSADAVSAGTSGSGSASAVDTTNMPMIPYYSDTEQVLYPLIVNGMSVDDTNGNPIGMSVTVNVRYNRVSSVYGIQTENYQSSAYDAITSTSTILTMAESTQSYPVMIYHTLENGTSVSGGSGGSAGSATSDISNSNIIGVGSNGGVVITRKLGTPTMVYEQMYETDTNGQNEMFLIPAFAFPVATTTSDTQSQTIMVPLISAFIQQSNLPSTVVPGSGPVTPMPPTAQ